MAGVDALSPTNSVFITASAPLLNRRGFVLWMPLGTAVSNSATISVALNAVFTKHRLNSRPVHLSSFPAALFYELIAISPLGGPM